MSNDGNGNQPSSTCRFCLKLAITKIDIFTDDFAKIVEILTSIKIKPDDKLPQVSCNECAKQIKEAFLLRRRILLSYRFLTKKLLSGTSRAPRNRRNAELYYVTATSPATEPKTSEAIEIKCSVQMDEDFSCESSDLNSISSFSDDKCGLFDAKTTLKTKENYQANDLLNKNFASTILNKNTQVNRTDSKLFCTTCQIQFSEAIEYKEHMRTHRFKACPICNEQVKNGYLKRHYAYKHDTNEVMCESCGITCKNQVHLKLHSSYHHNSSLSVCEDCGRTFKTKTKLSYHQRKDHNKERNFKCETCGKTFFLKTYLTKHINLRHKKLRLHTCEYCGKGFSGNNALRTHVRQHTNETPYQCNLCDASFKQKVSLRTHLKNVHNVKEDEKFFCDKCHKGFASSVALDVHSRLHLESIRCNICSDTFVELSYFEHHIASCHQDVDMDVINREVV